MPVKVEQRRFLEFIKTLERSPITTAARKTQFNVHVVEDSLFFVPLSSGKCRKEPANNLSKVLDHFNTSMSLIPKHYHDVTFNSVYILTLLKLYVTSLGSMN